MIIAMPVIENKGIDSRISEHFGHNPYFAICNSETRDVKIIPISEYGSGCTPVEEISKYKPDAVYTIGIGSRAMAMLKQLGIRITTGRFRTVKEVMDNLDCVEELEEGCGH